MEDIANKYQLHQKTYSTHFYDGVNIIEIFDKSLYNNYHLMIDLIESKIKLDVDIDPHTPILFAWFPSGFAHFTQQWLSVFDYDNTQKVDDLLILFQQNAYKIKQPTTTKDLKELADFTKTLSQYVKNMGNKYDTPMTWWDVMLIDELIKCKAIDALKELRKSEIYCFNQRNLELARYFYQRGDSEMTSVTEFLSNLLNGGEN